MTQATPELLPSSPLSNPRFSFYDLEEPVMNIREDAIVLAQLTQCDHSPGVGHMINVLLQHVGELETMLARGVQEAPQ